MQVRKCSFLPSVRQIQFLPGRRRGQEVRHWLNPTPTSPNPIFDPCLPDHLPLTFHLRPKPIPALPDHDQSLKEETDPAIPLETPPQVYNYTLIANLSSVHQKGAWPLPSAQPAILSLLSHLLSFEPWDTLDKGEKKNVKKKEKRRRKKTALLLC